MKTTTHLRSFVLASAAASLALVSGAGCQREASSSRRVARTATSAPAQPVGRDVAVHRFNTRPVVLGRARSARDTDLYGHARAHQLARRLCSALHRLPAARKHACCAKRGGNGFSAYGACLRTMSSALRARTIAVSAADVRRCERAMKRATAGCGWVGPWGPTMPAACDNIVHGRLARGARCRSSLECMGSLRCHGVGPRARGHCGPALGAGHRCGTAVDPLAVYTRQRSSETRHPECRGYCYRHKCAPVVAQGQRCKTTMQCGSGKHCAGGRCRAGLAARGSACAGGGCARGLRCVHSRCIAPRARGVKCTSDLECAGACIDGACAERCLPKILAHR